MMQPTQNGSGKEAVVRETGELGVFIVWADGRSEEDRILNALLDRFEVRSVIEVTWTAQLVTENFARFYGNYPLPPYSTYLEAQKGRGPFLLVTTIDRSPRYEERLTTSGPATVSVNFFEAKQRFRNWTGGGMRIHCTDSPVHAARDLMLLLGADPDSHLRDNPGPWDGRLRRTHRDLVGAHGWRSLAHLFRVLDYTVPYVVLPRIEGWPDRTPGRGRYDIDLLTSRYFELVRITRARPLLKALPRWGGQFGVQVGNQAVRLAFRFVGDGYYDPSWARAILDRRVRCDRGFFTPSDEDLFDSLVYDAFLHRRVQSSQDKERLSEAAVQMGRRQWKRSVLDDPYQVKGLVDDVLATNGHQYVKPRDVTVAYDFALAGHCWPGAQSRYTRVRARAASLLLPFVVHPLDKGYRHIRGKLARYIPWLRKLVDASRRATLAALHRNKATEYGGGRSQSGVDAPVG